jgi:translation initiation factor IF-3
MNKKVKQKERQHKLNVEITTQQIRLTGDGFKGEVMTLKEGLALANEKELDLVLLNENNGIGICKIINYEKYIYQQNKQQKQKSLDVKEIKLSYNISQNDLSYRIKHIQEFLTKGHKVKLTMQFRGREMLFVEKGQEVMLKLIVDVESFGVAENFPKLEGKKLQSTLKPKAKN